MSTPSKLDIIRAAGKLQRQIASEASQEVAAEVHAPADASNVTTRRKAPDAAAVNPLEQISVAQEELQDVSTALLEEQDLLRRLRRPNNPDTETEFEEFADAEDITADT